MEVQTSPHSLRSHGVTVARTHKHDWIYAVLLPVIIFVIVYLRRRDIYDLHHAVLGILFAVLVTAVITDTIKNAVGRPRPDFFWRCFPDGIDVYDRWGEVVCHGEEHILNAGHKSFPSGHTSWSFAGLGFLSLYLSGKIKAFDKRGHIAKLCVLYLPLICASLVGISRLDDYRHHWQDVFVGGILGLVVATVCYLQFFPPPYDVEGWGPYAYFKVLEALRGTSDSTHVNVHNERATEERFENEQAEGIDNNFHEAVLVHQLPSPLGHLELQDLESGRGWT